MKVIVTEDIVRNALNESIEEFILKESWFDRGNGKIVKDGFNWLKNAAAMYMDWRTNGRWNRKYGIRVNGNTKTGELYYLNKWLSYYKEKLNDIIYKANTPDRRDEYDLWERDPNNPNKETKKVNRYDYVGEAGAINYAKRYCTFQNFNDYIKSINPNRENVKFINTYIFNYITKQANNGNINAVLNNLNITTFYSSKEGIEYLKMNRQQQQSQQSQRRQNVQNAWNNRKSNQNSQPIPNNADGTFTLPTIRTPYDGQNKQYKGWVYSTDKNGNEIVVNPNNPKQAAFI